MISVLLASTETIASIETVLWGMKVEYLALVISLIAILFTALKDFILPLIRRPKIKFEYSENIPFRKSNVPLNGTNTLGCFLRFSVENTGKSPALNCRCQIYLVEKDSNVYDAYQGFPLRWANRPNSIERLNIGLGEREFIDLAVTIDTDNLIHLSTYHDTEFGIKNFIEPGKYLITLVFSGDNFSPYQLKFEIVKEDNKDPNKVKLQLIVSNLFLTTLKFWKRRR